MSIRIDRQRAEAGQFYWPNGVQIDTEQTLLSLLLPVAVREIHRRLDSKVEVLCGGPVSA